MFASLVGAHRTGKTSLARRYAEKHKVTFVETSVSAIFKDLGLDPASRLDFNTRLHVQEIILERLDGQYAKMAGTPAITDRSPIDMLGYTLADIAGHTVRPSDEERLARYVQNCFDVTNRRFTLLLLIQPGIPVVPAAGKASLSNAYIEHLNSLMLGLTCDQRIRVPHFYLPRQVIDMDERIGRLEAVIARSGVNIVEERRGVALH